MQLHAASLEFSTGTQRDRAVARRSNIETRETLHTIARDWRAKFTSIVFTASRPSNSDISARHKRHARGALVQFNTNKHTPLRYAYVMTVLPSRRAALLPPVVIRYFAKSKSDSSKCSRNATGSVADTDDERVRDSAPRKPRPDERHKMRKKSTRTEQQTNL